MPEADWLDDAETLTYLHSCISTRRQRVRVPETPMHLDAILADEDLTGGLEPRLGRAHLRTLTIMGFPSQTWPGLLDDLNRLAFPYRWSTRAICLDKTDATKVLARIRRQWFAKRKSIMAILKEVMTNEASVLMDTDAANKALDADVGLAGAGLRSRRRGLCHRDRHGLGRRSAHRRRAAASGREDHPGPRLHLHARDGQRDRGLARQPAGPCLRQCPPAADLDAQPRPHDAVLGGLGRAGAGRAFRGAAAVLRADRRLDAVPLLAACRRCRPHADRRPDRRRQKRAAGADGACSSAAMRARRSSPSISAARSAPRRWRWAATGTISAARSPTTSPSPSRLQPLAHIDDAGERAWAAEWIAALLAREAVTVTPELKEHLWSALTSLASAPVAGAHAHRPRRCCCSRTR